MENVNWINRTWHSYTKLLEDPHSRPMIVIIFMRSLPARLTVPNE